MIGAQAHPTTAGMRTSIHAGFQLFLAVMLNDYWTILLGRFYFTGVDRMQIEYENIYLNFVLFNADHRLT